jgi:hypothetical protein
MLHLIEQRAPLAIDRLHRRFAGLLLHRTERIDRLDALLAQRRLNLVERLVAPVDFVEAPIGVRRVRLVAEPHLVEEVDRRNRCRSARPKLR